MIFYISVSTMVWLLHLGVLYIVFTVTSTKPLTQKHDSEHVEVKEGVDGDDMNQVTIHLFS